MTQVRVNRLEVEVSGKKLLKGLSLDVSPGQLMGLIGPNGAGKSTLIKVLAGFRAADHGLVSWNGRDVRQWSARERAASCGYMPQHYVFSWDYSVRDLIELGAARAEASDQSITEAVRTHELEALVERRWSTLSGGERARSMLASVMVTAPALLLVDEPGASLDIRHRIDLLVRLRAAAANATVIVVMHDLELAARYCHRLVLLADGRIVQDALSADVIRPGALDRTFGVRFQRVMLQPDFDAVLGIPLPCVDK
jgi:ABC-type cobalamin/Fe3+-siderophores transport system ATPase subunit